jgi:hypothetical protein
MTLDELLASGRLSAPLAALASDVVARAGNTAEARDSMRDTLATYLRYPEWTDEFERALASADQFHAASDAVARLIAAGADPELLPVWLNAFHLELLSQDRDQDDDVVLEVIDQLVGF